MTELSQTPVGKIALKFAQALVAGEYEAAHKMLSASLGEMFPPARLQTELAAMIEYGDGPPDIVEVISIDDMREWPSRQQADVGWAYVAICGKDYSEAVAVVITDEGHRHIIRDLEWGRP
jgi:hypothetical protein